MDKKDVRDQLETALKETPREAKKPAKTDTDDLLKKVQAKIGVETDEPDAIQKRPGRAWGKAAVSLTSGHQRPMAF